MKEQDDDNEISPWKQLNDCNEVEDEFFEIDNKLISSAVKSDREKNSSKKKNKNGENPPTIVCLIMSGVPIFRTVCDELELNFCERLTNINRVDILVPSTQEQLFLYAKQETTSNIRFAKLFGASNVCNKVAFSRQLNRAKKIMPQNFAFWPNTWLLPEETSLFVTNLSNSQENTSAGEAEKKAKARGSGKKQSVRNKKSKKRATYIVKPDAGSQGDGIFLIRSSSDAMKLTGRSCVVQEYMNNPLLLDGYKFDLRLYVLVTRLNPLEVHICKEGMARFSTEKYEQPSEQNVWHVAMHLTNYSLNKRYTNFVHDNESADGGNGSKRAMTHTFDQLREQGVEMDGVWERICDVVKRTMLGILPMLMENALAASDLIFEHKKNNETAKMAPRTAECDHANDSDSESMSDSFEIPSPTTGQCFQLFGFDVILDDKLQPWLLEVNNSPSLSIESTLALHELPEDMRTEALSSAFRWPGKSAPKGSNLSNICQRCSCTDMAGEHIHCISEVDKTIKRAAVAGMLGIVLLQSDELCCQDGVERKTLNPILKGQLIEAASSFETLIQGGEEQNEEECLFENLRQLYVHISGSRGKMDCYKFRTFIKRSQSLLAKSGRFLISDVDALYYRKKHTDSQIDCGSFIDMLIDIIHQTLGDVEEPEEIAMELNERLSALQLCL